MNSRMREMTALGADWWNDSGIPSELGEAVALGAVGGTSNPVIVSQAARNNPQLCLPILERLIGEHREADEDALAWLLIEELARESARRLLPIFEATQGRKGFLSMQVSPKSYRSRAKMVEQALHLASLAPNIAIKAPATQEGIEAMEELTAAGVRINATVSFSVAQVLAVAEALQRGLARARPSAVPVLPYITLMVGRVDDQLKRVVEAEKISCTPGILDWAGIAVFKEAHRQLRARQLPGTLLAAAYRHEGHWAEIIGRDVLQTVPYTWWKQFDHSTRPVELTLESPVDASIVGELRDKFPDFRRAFDVGGMTPPEFVRYGATVHTLNQFLGGYADLTAFVRSALVR